MSARSIAVISVTAMLGGAVWWAVPAVAHRTVVSPYTFNRDVQPILRARCGSCHVDGGVASSLLRYDEAKAQSWFIQRALVAGRMPPWPAEGEAVPFKGAGVLTAREFDIVMTWAAGGSPRGTGKVGPATAPLRRHPPVAPDLVISVPPFTLPADAEQDGRETVLASGAAGGRWIQAVDLLDTGSIVRRAEIAMRADGRDQTIGLWLPGETPQWLEGNAAFRLAADASLVLRVHYQRPPAVVGAVTDRSRLAVHYARHPEPRPVEIIELRADGEFPFGSERTFSHAIDRPVRLVGIRPIGGPTDASVRLTVVSPDGSRSPLGSLQWRPGWPRRYAFAEPILLAVGVAIEVRIVPSRGLLWSTLTADLPIGPAEGGPFRLALEILQ